MDVLQCNKDTLSAWEREYLSAFGYSWQRITQYGSGANGLVINGEAVGQTRYAVPGKNGEWNVSATLADVIDTKKIYYGTLTGFVDRTAYTSGQFRISLYASLRKGDGVTDLETIFSSCRITAATSLGLAFCIPGVLFHNLRVSNEDQSAGVGTMLCMAKFDGFRGDCV